MAILMMRKVPVCITVEPVYWDDPPIIRIGFNSEIYHEGELCEETTFQWEFPAEDSNTLVVEMLNKHEGDTQDGKDKALVIKTVGIEGMVLTSFLHASKYTPEYGLGFFDYVARNGIPVEEVCHGQTYLGFNGPWSLTFTWPTFLWIYQTETHSMGWIYEINI